jgi:hypothetical protein
VAEVEAEGAARKEAEERAKEAEQQSVAFKKELEAFTREEERVAREARQGNGKVDIEQTSAA